ncbi:MAG: penicillin-binding protein activator LpoB [Gammaproteobacteria bacterium]
MNEMHLLSNYSGSKETTDDLITASSQQKFARIATVSALLMSFLSGCTVYDTKPDNTSGRPTIYNDPTTVGTVAGVGIESQDIASMSDLMMRDILSTPVLAGRTAPPRVIIDSEYFVNESSSRINKNIITDRLRIQLNRAAAGRMFFIGRHYSDMVQKERQLKRQGIVDEGSMGMTRKVAGADFRLGGRITSLDARGSNGVSRFHQIIFEMVELETGAIVWSNMYDFRKTAQDDIIYR